MLDEILTKWDEILKLMKEDFDIADVSFKTWILPLKAYSVENDVVNIIVPEEQTGLKYIEKKYTTPFKVTISEVMNHEFDIKFISTNDIKKISRQHQNQMDKAETDYSSLGINPKLTFDTFVVGENNNFAHAASLAVAESPGEVYNPLFIYGGVGLGKTHLMQAIANFIMQNNPSLKVQYVTSEVFTNELIESIRTEKNTSNKSFREKYRSVDVLLIDDIQFIIGKESTQDEFFHTFNTLRGVLADISPPNYETRMAILHKKEELESYNVDNEILDYIATNVKSNIRELEGSLNKLVAYSKLTHREINLKFAEEVLKDIISPNAHREVTPDLIIQVVADHFGITTADISSQRRSNEIAYPRQIAMYLCRFMTDVPYETIGSYMGKRDHSTVKYGVDKISKELKSDTSLANTIDVIMKKINPS